MSQKMKALSDEQIFIAAVAYESSNCQLPMDEFLQHVSDRFEEANKAYHSLRHPVARIGNKGSLGL